MEQNMRTRASRQYIRVTFPDGKEFCYKSSTSTMIAVLKYIGADNFPKIKLELCYLPILSKTPYPKYEKYMKSVCDGWYLNTQSDTTSKYMQLCSINQQLKLGLKIEIGTDLPTTEDPDRVKKTKVKDKLLVRFPDGEYFANASSTDTFLEVVWQLGVDEIKRKDLQWGDKELITHTKLYNGQIQVGENRWIYVPTSTQNKVKLLRVISAMLRIKLDISVI